jgi:thioredoxin-like negative regulator of GroEL
MDSIQDLEQLNQEISSQKGLLVYFSNDACSVCKVLKPRVDQVISEAYPLIKRYYVDIEKSPLIAGQYRVFTIPTILIFFEGREHARLSRNIGMHQVEEAIHRPYGLVFEE